MAASRIGAESLLLTQNLDTIGQMSCNPAIGGSAKGHIVREIDALGGAMGVNADATGIHFRVLNRSKGPSVRALRVQCDKKAYQLRLKALLERTANLDIKQAGVVRILTKDDRVAGVETDFGCRIRSRSVVVTAGTFLRGLLHIGDQRQTGGRMADVSSPLSDDLRAKGFQVGRFKTGTPCRLHSASIDFRKLERQNGDEVPERFSFLPATDEFLQDEGYTTLNRGSEGEFHVEQISCWITHTTSQTHDIIRRNLGRSALYSGNICGTGPRYCPSIEDKVVKFPHRDKHQIFLEPEGRDTQEFYVNGLSTSLPYDVQIEFIRSIPGLEKAEIMRPGYAVEYDYFPPTQLRPPLETKLIGELYFAGQINGTSGYEEAAAQGLIAGANAALAVMQQPAFTLGRDEAYIGVLIDDLVNKGAPEPYRMFTSRAEHRLLLRHDTADLRLTPRASTIGLVDQRRLVATEGKSFALQEARLLTQQVRVNGQTLFQLMKRPDVAFGEFLSPLVRKRFDEKIWELVATEAKYEGYIQRQNFDLEAIRASYSRTIPGELDYAVIPGLRNEARQKLTGIRPATLGQAARLSGVTPSDLGILSVWLKNLA